MDLTGSILAHHSEAIDPTLAEWIRHKIDEVLGLEAGTIVLLLGSLIVLFPVILLALVWFQRHRAARRAATEE
jgi:hypothetical protein